MSPYRKTWRGRRIYATDGDQYQLPASEDILDAGYHGYPCDGQETHYPRMYVVHFCDMITGVTKEFRYANTN